MVLVLSLFVLIVLRLWYAFIELFCCLIFVLWLDLLFCVCGSLLSILHGFVFVLDCLVWFALSTLVEGDCSALYLFVFNMVWVKLMVLLYGCFFLFVGGLRLILFVGFGCIDCCLL